MIRHLFIKTAKGAPLLSVDEIHCSASGGITGNLPTPPLRQILLVATQALEKFSLQPGDLRENVVLVFPNLCELASGTVLGIGEVKIRLTIHCEPCRRIADKVNITQIKHERGFLGLFLNTGTIKKTDTVEILSDKYSPIPDQIAERIVWYLDQRMAPITATELAWQIGVDKSYCRAFPVHLRKLPAKYQRLVIFGNREDR